jgi:hypothetical protein
MGKTYQVIALVIVVAFIASGIMTTKSASGATNLSVPEFTLKLVAYPYEIPIYTVDESTGETVAQQGYLMENRSIEVKIKNPTTNKAYTLYFEVQMKDPNWQSWHTGLETSGYGHYSIDPPYSSYLASEGEYTVISCYANYTVGTKLDFQVKAYYGQTIWHDTPGYPLRSYCTFEVITSSSWSPTQSLLIGEPEYHTETSSTPSSQTTPVATPTKSAAADSDNVQQAQLGEFLFGFKWKDITIGLLVAAVAVLAAIILLKIRHKKS